MQHPCVYRITVLAYKCRCGCVSNERRHSRPPLLPRLSGASRAERTCPLLMATLRVVMDTHARCVHGLWEFFGVALLGRKKNARATMRFAASQT